MKRDVRPPTIDILNQMAVDFIRRGYQVDLVLYRVEGPLLEIVPEGARVIGLKTSPGFLGRALALASDPGGIKELLLPVLLPRQAPSGLAKLPDLVSYLRRERPIALIAAFPHENVIAVMARRLAGVPTRIAVSERDTVIPSTRLAREWKRRFLPALARREYLNADAIIAVSNGVADQLADRIGIPRQRIVTVYNPVVGPDLPERAREPIEHPWFAPGEVPVILGAGRLHEQKDFPTLLHAFARVRAERPARLVILGQAKTPERTEVQRRKLLGLAASLGVADDIDLPGFVLNPLAYMARAAAFVLSSVHEGLPSALIQALACGCPVVSTDCPSGPAEILDGARYGALVPVRDSVAMAESILTTLMAPPDPRTLQSRAAMFSVEQATQRYLEVMGLLPSAPINAVAPVSWTPAGAQSEAERDLAEVG